MSMSQISVPWRRNRVTLAASVLFTLLIACYYYYLKTDQQFHHWIINRHKTDERANRLWLVVPASSPSENLCKTLMSAAVLRFPEAVLVNWGKSFDRQDVLFGGSHIGKIQGISEFLETVGGVDIGTRFTSRSNVDDDLVLVVDAYDVWFQLPPQVLIERFYRINKEAYAKTRVRQSIIFSTQKKCWPTPEVGSDPRCPILPESSLPPDTYGPSSDIEHPENEAEQFHDNRPRYLNSGSVIGRLADMKLLFRRANEKVWSARLRGRELFSDQGVFAEILGEQHVARAWAQQQTNTSAPLDIENVETSSIVSKLEQGKTNFEFGVGLDYAQELIVPTVFSENDAEFQAHADLSDAERAPLHSIQNFSAPASFDDEFAKLEAPLTVDGQARLAAENVNASLSPSLAKKSWASVPLYTNLYTRKIPVGIHHNAWRNGLKERISTFWNRTWYAPHLRGLLAAYIVGHVEQIATVSDEMGDLHRYWPPAPYSYYRGARIFHPQRLGVGFETLGWNEICSNGSQDWTQEVFRDGKGLWTDPR